MSDRHDTVTAWTVVLLALCVLVLAVLDWLRAGQIQLLEEDVQTMRRQMREFINGQAQAKTTAPGVSRARPKPKPEGGAV